MTLLLSERKLLVNLLTKRLASLRLKWGKRRRLQQWEVDTITETERLLLKLAPARRT